MIVFAARIITEKIDNYRHSNFLITEKIDNYRYNNFLVEEKNIFTTIIINSAEKIVIEI